MSNHGVASDDSFQLDATNKVVSSHTTLVSSKHKRQKINHHYYPNLPLRRRKRTLQPSIDLQKYHPKLHTMDDSSEDNPEHLSSPGQENQNLVVVTQPETTEDSGTNGNSDEEGDIVVPTLDDGEASNGKRRFVNNGEMRGDKGVSRHSAIEEENRTDEGGVSDSGSRSSLTNMPVSILSTRQQKIWDDIQAERAGRPVGDGTTATASTVPHLLQVQNVPNGDNQSNDGDGTTATASTVLHSLQVQNIPNGDNQPNDGNTSGQRNLMFQLSFLPRTNHFRHPKQNSTNHGWLRNAQLNYSPMKQVQFLDAPNHVTPVKDIPDEQVMTFIGIPSKYREFLHQMGAHEDIKQMFENALSVDLKDGTEKKVLYFHQHTNSPDDDAATTDDSKMPSLDDTPDDIDDEAQSLFDEGIMDGMSFQEAKMKGIKNTDFCYIKKHNLEAMMNEIEEYFVREALNPFRYLTMSELTESEFNFMQAVQQQATDEMLEAMLPALKNDFHAQKATKLRDWLTSKIDTTMESVKNHHWPAIYNDFKMVTIETTDDEVKARRNQILASQSIEVTTKEDVQNLNVVVSDIKSMIDKKPESCEIVLKLHSRIEAYERKAGFIESADDMIQEISADMLIHENMDVKDARERYSNRQEVWTTDVIERSHFIGLDQKGDHKSFIMQCALEKTTKVGFGKRNGGKPASLLAPFQAEIRKEQIDGKLTTKNPHHIGYKLYVPLNLKGGSLQVWYFDENGVWVHDVLKIPVGCAVMLRADVLTSGLFEPNEIWFTAVMYTPRSIWCTSKRDLLLVHKEDEMDKYLPSVLQAYRDRVNPPKDYYGKYEYYVGRPSYLNEDDNQTTDDVKKQTGGKSIDPWDVNFMDSNLTVHPNPYIDTSILKAYCTQSNREFLVDNYDCYHPMTSNLSLVHTPQMRAQASHKRGNRRIKKPWSYRKEQILKRLETKYDYSIPYIAHIARVKSRRKHKSKEKWMKMMAYLNTKDQMQMKDVQWYDVVRAYRKCTKWWDKKLEEEFGSSKKQKTEGGAGSVKRVLDRLAAYAYQGDDVSDEEYDEEEGEKEQQEEQE